MKLKPYIVAGLLMCWALTCSTMAHAQEGKMQQDADPVLKDVPRNEPDPLLSSESESRSTKNVLPATTTKETPRDSAQQVKFTKPAKASEKEEKEEDPLSFNFLYYIIGKFKLSDIIE